MPKSTFPSRVPVLFDYLADFFKRNPGADSKYAWANAVRVFPDLAIKEFCFNCGSSMESTVYTADALDGLTLVKIAQKVKLNCESGMTMEQANMVHVQTLDTTYGAKSRTTQCAYLGWIEQPKEKGKTGYWRITDLGWKVLQGEPTSRTVTVFRKEVIKRSTDSVTLPVIFSTNIDKINDALLRRKAIKDDYRADFSSYNARDWFDIGRAQPGRMI